MKLGEDDSVPVGLEVDLVAANVAAHQTGSGQLLQLALYGGNNLTRTPRLIEREPSSDEASARRD